MGEPEFITEVGPNDVLFGRGSGPNGHDGNVRFRALVNQRKEEYLRTNHRQTKVKIAGEIVDEVLSRGGRFLKRVDNNKDNKDKSSKGGELYVAVDHDTMMEKAKQALRQNLERQQDRRNSSMSTADTSSPHGRNVAPRMVSPGDPYEPDPLPSSMSMQQQQLFDYATAQVTSNNNSGSMYSQQGNALSELCGSMDISDLIQTIVNVRKDEYFAASDPSTKAAIAREIVDAALAESGRARKNSTYDALLQQQQQQNAALLAAASMNNGFSNNSNTGFAQQVQSSSTATSSMSGGGAGGFNMYTMARAPPPSTTSSGQFATSSQNSMQPPLSNAGVTMSNNYSYDRQAMEGGGAGSSSKKSSTTLPDGFNLIGGFPAAAAGKNSSSGSSSSKSSSKKRSKSSTSSKPNMDDQPSLNDDEYALMMEQYMPNGLTSPSDSNSALLDGPLGMTDQDSIGTFNQSASELDSMAESASMMSFNSKARGGGGIDSFLSANAPKSSSKSGMSRGSRKSKGSALKAHFATQDLAKGSSKNKRTGNSSVMSSSIMSSKSHRSTKSNRSAASAARDDMSIMSGMSQFSGMSRTDELSLMSEMTDLSEALNSLDLASLPS